MTTTKSSMAVKDTKESALTVKAGVDTEFAAMQVAEVVATMPHIAPIADKLMKAAGY